MPSDSLYNGWRADGTSDIRISLPSRIRTLRSALERFPRTELGKFPSPLYESATSYGKLWIKNDGACSSVYAGNKVRKLEYLLASAQAQGARELVVFGDFESHTVAATAILGGKMGLEVTAVLYPHKSQSYSTIEQIMEQSGCRVVRCSRFISAALTAQKLRIRRGVFYIPLGASTPTSTLGYVEAALELVEQFLVLQQTLPERIYLPFATGGTVAGLVVGFAMLECPTQVVAVRTVESLISSRRNLEQLIHRTWLLIRNRYLAPPSIDQNYFLIVDDFLGRGYRADTPACLFAAEKAREVGLRLETAFSSKAFAAACSAISPANNSVLFWNTHSQA